MTVDYRALIEPLAIRFWGQPNRAQSTATVLRFGTNGSKSVDKIKAIWFDHEAGQGGGVVELVRREVPTDEPGKWIADEYPEYADRGNGADRGQGKLGDFVEAYDYRDEAGTVLFPVVRFDNPKDFRQRKPDPSKASGWDWHTKGVRQIPFKLPELMRAIAEKAKGPFFIVEGERDVNRLRQEGVIATCNSGGAGKWKGGLSAYFQDLDVVIVADADPQARDKNGTPLWHEDGRPKLPGQDHAHAVACSLQPYAARIRVLDLGKAWPECPSKGDISDWFNRGKTLEELFTLIAALPDWKPEDARRGATVGPLGAPAPAPGAAPGGPPSLSDDDVAEAFKGADFTFLPVSKLWRKWDETSWAESTATHAEAAIGAWLRKEVKPHVKKAKERKDIGSQSKLAAIERRLRSLRIADERTFDAHQFKLNTAAGTAKLKEDD